MPPGRRERQRLALARALLAGFDVLVLDEPTEHIDWATASALLVDLLEANRARTVLPITHRHVRGDRLDMVLRLADGRLST